MKRTMLMLAMLLMSCSRPPRATDADCSALFDRIVAIELEERGFHDPVLRARKTAALHRTLAAELQSCPGRPLRKGALECAAGAPNTESLSHRCLR